MRRGFHRSSLSTFTAICLALASLSPALSLRGEEPGSAPAPAPTTRVDASFASIVPADVHFCAYWKPGEARRQLVQPFCRAMGDLARSGIGKDLFDLATLDLPPEAREEARKVTRHVMGLLGTPKWKALFHEEFALAFKLNFPIPEYLFLFRVPADRCTEHREDMKRMFQGFSEMSQGRVQVVDETAQGAGITRLEMPGLPVSLSVASKGTILMVSTSPSFLSRALELMDSADAAGSIEKDPRILSNFEGLGEMGDAAMYFDMPAYMQFIRGALNMAAGAMGNDPQAVGALDMARTVIDELARLGPICSIERAEGDRLIADTKLAFQGGERPGFIETLAAEQKPLPAGLVKFMPKDTMCFSFTSGVNVSRIYQGITDLIRDKLPRGPRMLERWGRIQDRVGFHLEEDLLSWLTGMVGWVVLPGRPAGKGPEVILVVGVRDEAKCSHLLLKIWEHVQGFLESRGQKAELGKLPKISENFREIRIAAFPWMRPVVGVENGVLVLASSAQAMERVKAAAEGKAPNITERKDFAALGMPEGPLAQFSYADVRGSLKGLANLVSGAGFFLSVLPEKDDTRHARKIGTIFTKLSVFLRAVDLGVDVASWTHYDEARHALFTRQVSRVRGAGKRSF
jgi:hypothetical protein